jgi:hypothetical protein
MEIIGTNANWLKLFLTLFQDSAVGMLRLPFPPARVSSEASFGNQR